MDKHFNYHLISISKYLKRSKPETFQKNNKKKADKEKMVLAKIWMSFINVTQKGLQLRGDHCEGPKK